MSYKKIGWVSGETPLSATNLNHMEEGISTIDSAVGTDAYDPTKTYSKGDYFIYNDSLCKAIADIAAGAELLSGVNYSTTTVHEELTELNSNLGKIFYTKPISKYDDSVTLNATNTWQGITSIGMHTYANIPHIMKLEAINATNSTVTISLGIGQANNTIPDVILGSAYVDPWKSISLSTLIHNSYDRDYVFFIKSGGNTVSYMKMEYLSFNMTSH